MRSLERWVFPAQCELIASQRVLAAFQASMIAYPAPAHSWNLRFNTFKLERLHNVLTLHHMSVAFEVLSDPILFDLKVLHSSAARVGDPKRVESVGRSGGRRLERVTCRDHGPLV